jgi:predicted RND superfamily exporter protein
MWYTLGKFILKYRLQMLLLLTVITAFMGWKASQVQLSYDFTRALPTDNQKYREYQQLPLWWAYKQIKCMIPLFLIK